MLSCFLSACGFHLRGQGGEGALSQRKDMSVYLSVSSDDNLLRRQITNDLQASDIKVVTEPELSHNHLVIVSSKLSKRAIGVDSNGRNNEFELSQSVSFVANSFRDNLSVEKQQAQADLESHVVTARRSFYLDNIDLIGKRAEEQSLLESIREEASRKIISRFLVAVDNQQKNNEFE